MTNDELVRHLVNTGVLQTPRIKDAFMQIDRADFVDGPAYADAPLPIGSGQTISQPTVVAFMLELLQPEPGDSILDVGSGSGYTTALLRAITEDVRAVELEPELVRYGKENVRTYFSDVQFYQGDRGLPEHGPYDKILVSAAAEELPQELLDQLTEDGVMVIPVKNAIWKVTPDGVEKHEGFRFVPLRFNA